jgi:hypothetical protein
VRLEVGVRRGRRRIRGCQPRWRRCSPPRPPAIPWAGRRAKAKRSSLRHLSAALSAVGHPASRATVSRLLREFGYSPKVKARRTEARRSPPERDAQFRRIAQQREQFQAAGEPIIGVDTKKRELVGNFKNAGRAWRRTAEAVLVHDWPQDAIGQAIP